MISKILKQYDLVIFDCDGVIIDCNLLKCEAFGKSVSEYPNYIVESFVDHCKETFGISRYIKFKEFFSEFAKEPFDENKYQIFLNRYSSLCKELYYDANLTPGAVKLLSLLKDLGYKLYVASGSDENELVEVFEKRNLINFFIKIYGSPMKKKDCIKHILKSNPVSNAVFIGDSLSDLKACKENNLDFIYMREFSVQSLEKDEICRKEAKVVIERLDDLL